MNAARKLKPIEANDGTYRYGSMVLAAFDALEDAARNPCINPQPGDRVTVAGETREVENVSGDRVIYSWPGKVAVRTMYIDAWRAWSAVASSYTLAELATAEPA